MPCTVASTDLILLAVVVSGSPMGLCRSFVMLGGLGVCLLHGYSS